MLDISKRLYKEKEKLLLWADKLVWNKKENVGKLNQS